MKRNFIIKQVEFPTLNNQPISPAIPVIDNGPMNKMAMVAEMGVIHELRNLYFHSPRLTWLQLLLSAGSANSRDQSEAQI